MDPITQQTALAAAGAGDDPVYVDDLFSIHQWDGSGFSRQIPTGIDMTTDGGMVWTKVRDYSDHHYIADTTRKTGSYYDELSSSQSYGSITGRTWGIDTFLSTGIQGGGNNGQFNSQSYKYVSWSFRRAPGFFDIVRWTGDQTSNRKISHQLGTVPGAIWIKRVDGSGNWVCWHKNLNGNGNGYNHLNTNNPMQTSAGHVVFGDGTNYIAPTDTEFTVGLDSYVNWNNFEYIAYIFADNATGFGKDGNEDIIRCGTYTGNGNANGPTVNLGWEPQWLLIKGLEGYNNWLMIDSQRGFNHEVNDQLVYAQSPNTEVGLNYVRPLGNGFAIEHSNSNINSSGQQYMYIAIRRPQKKPEVGTEVFKPLVVSGGSTMNVGFKADMAIAADRTNSSSIAQILETRASRRYFATGNSDAEGGSELYSWEKGNDLILPSTGGNFVNLVFKRARGFIDILLHKGTGTTANIPHGLGVAPEMVWVKKRNGAEHWAVYHVNAGANKYLHLNLSSQAYTDAAFWANTTPTASNITVGWKNFVNQNNFRYLVIAFASCPGVSKVGYYTGTGSAGNNVDCGFTNGARFVMVKNATSSGDWWFADTARGINAGNDPFLRLNNNNTENNTVDWIDAYSAGFTINGTGGDYNDSGQTYLFYAVA